MALYRFVRHSLVMSCCLCVIAAGTFIQAAAAPSLNQVGQEGKDVIWVPTPQVLVDAMLDMAKVTPKDFVIDLGSGDGVPSLPPRSVAPKPWGLNTIRTWSPCRSAMRKEGFSDRPNSSRPTCLRPIFPRPRSLPCSCCRDQPQAPSRLLDMKTRYADRIQCSPWGIDSRRDRRAGREKECALLLYGSSLDCAGQKCRYVETSRRRTDAGTDLSDIFRDTQIRFEKHFYSGWQADR